MLFDKFAVKVILLQIMGSDRQRALTIAIILPVSATALFTSIIFAILSVSLSFSLGLILLFIGLQTAFHSVFLFLLLVMRKYFRYAEDYRPLLKVNAANRISMTRMSMTP
jgi:hypothetical protein